MAVEVPIVHRSFDCPPRVMKASRGPLLLVNSRCVVANPFILVSVLHLRNHPECSVLDSHIVRICTAFLLTLLTAVTV